ncbi:hypothetical protein HanHA300_Chr17g0646471 [Helianthus annuus]|nr:hypothetical protein HanHA300_Chr17g0646471 [Helianthus annuus]KAJ0446809.1 hypothetical protein HanHA89_Chr17g0698371 [Helianthus annuus]KAJ0631702.1 hypothetical protein HanLR1_Chr17g0656911 [Helianthus annuus]KAJ0635613.1 hypothetical protein HanOQP8_Chr17g0652821 [Helianthus annuus]
MSAREDSDSDAPEEFTAEQAIQKDEEITTIQIQNKASQLSSKHDIRNHFAPQMMDKICRRQSKAMNDLMKLVNHLHFLFHETIPALQTYYDTSNHIIWNEER